MPHTIDVGLVLKHFETLRGDRTQFDILRQRVAEVVWPDANDFFATRVPGEHRTREVYDSTGGVLLERFAAIEESLLTPRAQRWHGLEPSDENLAKDSDVKAFFQRATKVLFDRRADPKAKYYDQKHVGYKSLGAFGDECLFVDESPTGIRYVNCHVGQVYIAENHYKDVDTVYRKFPMTAKAAEQMWANKPNATLPPKVQDRLKNDPFCSFEFLHCVMPNPDFDPESLSARALPWASLYIGMDEKFLIEHGGYHEMPYMYSRYTLNPNESLGRSPAMLVLPSLQMLQEMAITYIKSGHKANDPPLLVHSDETGGQQDYFLMPGGINFGALNSQGQPLIAPLQTGADVRGMENMIDREREQSSSAFISDVALMKALQENPQMTATQVLELVKVEGRQTAPAIGRQQAEMLGPQIEREIAIAMRRGWFGEIPPVLIEARGQYEIKYVSEATRQQSAAEIVAMDRLADRVLALAPVAPSAVDAINVPAMIRKTGEFDGVPQEVLASEDEIIAKGEARAQAEQQAKLAELAQMAGGVAKDFAAAGQAGA